ncbi:hypothetical protein [Kutzneria chonburiensis]|uniref:Secreted protein n=1 Tax=Kutzneria chonburiensis TaxID=1483604 RepID=A0ABV6MVQ9_9PSEU|nr:hypothetical protein [Kutzneria chonburiensis]
MLRKLLVVVPALAMVAATVGSASAAPAPAAPAAAPRAACTADTPEVKALAASMTAFMSAVSATPPDTAAVQSTVGDMITELVALQKAGCLQLAAPPARIQDPQACLTDLQGMGAALFQLLAAVLKAPPDPTGITAATTAIGAAITKFNNDNCLPIKLPVPGAPPLPGGGGVPAPPGGLPAPPTIPGT